ncbi:MAG: outer membrane beta-barrel protein [Saprospiraceae bacterium]|nr:outer membrane beta-barrel protein [Saprospiraceae bacterium]
MTGLAVGVGNSGFNLETDGEDQIKNLYYPVGGIQIQKRIHKNWAINVFPNVGLSGNIRKLAQPFNGITEIKTTSAFVNIAIHPKYYFNKLFYLSAGPEYSYLLWNYGTTYNNEVQLTRIKETQYFNRSNLFLSSAVGLSLKAGESRKNAPVQIDVLWYLEFRFKKGITNLLKADLAGNEVYSNITAIELVTGISFSSKQ